MGIRSHVAWVATVILIVGLRAAHADPKGDVAAKIKEAMESYDMMDYDAARKSLNQAIATAKKSKLDKDPVLARAYLDLGIVAFAVPDVEGAKVSFLSAVQIDAKIQIDAAYKSAEMAKLLDEARSEAAGGGASAKVEPSEPSADCKSVKGLQHTLIDTAKGNTALPMEALLASDIKPTKVAIMYRAEGATEFTEVKMTKDGCKYTGQIPAAGMHGSLVHYYVAAFDGNGKPMAAKGSAGSPNIIEVSGGPSTPVKGDDEDPLGGGKKVVDKPPPSGGGGSGGGEVTSGVTIGPKQPRVMLAVSGGTGFGYVTGTTEANNTVRNCCIGNSLVVVMPEIGFYINHQTTIGLVARIGFPVDANVDPMNSTHATLAPAGLVRVRYMLSKTGDGVHVMGEVGAGIIRNTIKLDAATAGMDTDIVAQGPLLVGGGVGFTKRIAGNVALLVDLGAVAGIAVVSSLGSAPALNTGVTADLTLGLRVGF
jgi:hypothetical protein